MLSCVSGVLVEGLRSSREGLCTKFCTAIGENGEKGDIGLKGSLLTLKPDLVDTLNTGGGFFLDNPEL